MVSYAEGCPRKQSGERIGLGLGAACPTLAVSAAATYPLYHPASLTPWEDIPAALGRDSLLSIFPRRRIAAVRVRAGHLDRRDNLSHTEWV